MAKHISEIDINQPELTIRLKDLTWSCSIHSIMEEKEIKNYAYAITCGDVVMKVGESSDNAHIYGDRIIRQVGNIPGFDEDRKSGCGKDILSVIAAVEKKHEVKVHKDDCTVRVWDVTQIEETRFCERRISLQAEDSLLTQHERQHGGLPVGNFKDTRAKNTSLARGVTYTTFAALFEEV